MEFLDCIIIGVGENEKRDNKQNRYVLYNVIQPKVAHTQLTHNTRKTVDDTRVSPTCLRCRKARRILPENVFGGQHSTEELEHFSHAEFCYMLPTFARNLSFLRPHGRHGSHCYSRGVLQNYRRTVWIDVIDESFPHRLVVHRSLRIAASEALVLQKKISRRNDSLYRVSRGVQLNVEAVRTLHEDTP